MKTLKQNLENMTSEKTINTAIEELTNVLIDASENCSKLTKTPKREMQKNKKECFDSECYSKRKGLGKLLSNNPHDIDIRNTYFQTKKQYKKMIKLKERNFKEEKLKSITSLGQDDVKQKWQIIKSIPDPDKNKVDPASEINLGRWHKYFHTLYNNNQMDGELPKQINNSINKIDETTLRKMKKKAQLSIYKARNSLLQRKTEKL